MRDKKIIDENKRKFDGNGTDVPDCLRERFIKLKNEYSSKNNKEYSINELTQFLEKFTLIEDEYFKYTAIFYHHWITDEDDSCERYYEFAELNSLRILATYVLPITNRINDLNTKKSLQYARKSIWLAWGAIIITLIFSIIPYFFQNNVPVTNITNEVSPLIIISQKDSLQIQQMKTDSVLIK